MTKERERKAIEILKERPLDGYLLSQLGTDKKRNVVALLDYYEDDDAYLVADYFMENIVSIGFMEEGEVMKTSKEGFNYLTIVNISGEQYPFLIASKNANINELVEGSY